MVYAGLWGSNVDFNEAAAVDGASFELEHFPINRGHILQQRSSFHILSV